MTAPIFKEYWHIYLAAMVYGGFLAVLEFIAGIEHLAWILLVITIGPLIIIDFHTDISIML